MAEQAWRRGYRRMSPRNRSKLQLSAIELAGDPQRRKEGGASRNGAAPCHFGDIDRGSVFGSK